MSYYETMRLGLDEEEEGPNGATAE
jgi:hypothetical protein